MLTMLHSIQQFKDSHVKTYCLALLGIKIFGAELQFNLTQDKNLKALSHLACNNVSVHSCSLVCLASRNLGDKHRTLIEMLHEYLVG